MIYPNFREEKKLWKIGYDFVIGVDEAGRGPLAGPVVAAAVVVICPKKGFRAINFLKKNNLLAVKDSKKLSPNKREKVFTTIVNSSVILWGIGSASEKVIDRINILEATKLAMKRAVKNLIRKMICSFGDTRDNRSYFLIIDGRFPIDIDIPQKPIIRGDEKVFSVSAASIIAKTRRDKIMKQLDKKYPQYHFGQHKGYGTKLHLAMLKKYGVSDVHRKTFSSCCNL